MLTSRRPGPPPPCRAVEGRIREQHRQDPRRAPLRSLLRDGLRWRFAEAPATPLASVGGGRACDTSLMIFAGLRWGL